MPHVNKLKYCLGCIIILITLTFSTNFKFIEIDSEPRITTNSQLLQSKVTEKNRIFFLKTHKCASSTIQNILMRYGHKKNLDFVLPNENNYIGNPDHFNSSMVNSKYSTADSKFDIFAHHTRYSQEVKSVMRPNTVYITILREPTTLFQSIYSFYHFDKKYKTNITDFINNRLLEKSSSTNYVKRYSKKLGLNQMSWDSGLFFRDFQNINMINKHINMIEKDFDFVMIFEYFDASLVLLANLMQWPIEQVAYLPLNTRNDSFNQMLSNEDVNKLKKISVADNMLYNRFLQKFKEKVNEYGIDKLKRGMARLLAINQEILDTCIESMTNKGYAKTISYILKENANNNCKYMALNELKYTSFLREIQYERQRKFKALDKFMNNS